MTGFADFEIFFDFSSSYLFVLKEDKIQKVNQPFCDALGYEQSSLLGTEIFKIILSKDLTFFKNGYENSQRVIAQTLTSKKRAVRVEWEFKTIGEYKYVKGVDVTEKLKHQEKFEQYSVLLRGVNESLERSSHRLFLLQSALTTTIPFAKNSIENILKITQQSFKMNSALVLQGCPGGLKITKVIGPKDTFLGDEIKSTDAISRRVFQQTSDFQHKIIQDELKNDEQYLNGVGFYIGFPISFNDKKLGVIEFLFNDPHTDVLLDNNDLQFLKLITEVVGRTLELKRINKELEDKSIKLKSKNDELDEFAHIVSHDLKAPLRAIQNLIHFITEEKGNQFTEESTEDFQLISQRAVRMSSLIEGILQYSRIGREVIPTSDFSLKEMVLEVTDQLKPMNPKVEFSLGEFFPTIHNKELFMFQIISNLVSNAIKYNDKEKPFIKIDIEEKESKWILSVEDNGPGISKEYRERVFIVFETLQGRDEIESTGIGLTIVKKMSVLMGGDVKIEDSELGGAKFLVEFPSKN